MKDKQPYVHAGTVIDGMRAVARAHGYAIGLHGSLRAESDIDLLAVPWAAWAHAYSTLTRAMLDLPYLRRQPGNLDALKPHGRWATTYLISHRVDTCPHYVDLQVTPRRQDRQ
jgi:hypothetical protein